MAMNAIGNQERCKGVSSMETSAVGTFGLISTSSERPKISFETLFPGKSFPSNVQTAIHLDIKRLKPLNGFAQRNNEKCLRKLTNCRQRCILQLLNSIRLDVKI